MGETRRTEGIRMEMATLTHKFFSWPDYTVLSSRPHLALLFLGQVVLNWRPSVGHCGTLRQQGTQLLADAPVIANWDWPKTHTPYISYGHLHISLHNTHTFLFNHVTASGYFHRCVLSRESLIDSSVKGQYEICRDAVSVFYSSSQLGWRQLIGFFGCFVF